MKQTDEISKENNLELMLLFGNWKEIADLENDGNESSVLPYYKIAALYQLGRTDEAKALIKSMPKVDVHLFGKYVISGIYNCLAKMNYLLDQFDKGDELICSSINAIKTIEEPVPLAKIRKLEQLSQINIFQSWTSLASDQTLSKKKKLFIDCGGYDGCSVIKFLLSEPDYDVITFEANPELWGYYDKIPTTLIKKAVYDYDGQIEFSIDPIDADGSSLIKEKKIDFNGIISNEDCPKLTVDCVDLSNFIKQQSQHYTDIVLKLDVEGAEYKILNKMLDDGTIKIISKLYAEFHWKKIGMDDADHFSLIEKLEKYVEIEYWDSHEFAVHKKDKSAIRRRFALINALVR